MPRRTQKSIQQELEKQAAIFQQVNQFFGGITKQEAYEVFRILALLAQFPGSMPPEPLEGCEVRWTSTLKPGDKLSEQVFGVTAIYKGIKFEYTANRDRVMQLPDSTFMHYDSWDYQESLVKERTLMTLTHR